MRYLLYRWGWAALDLLFPPSCASCMSPGTRWCQTCRDQTTQIIPPYCQYCGQPTKGKGACRSCSQARPGLTAIRSWAVFDGPIRDVLHRVKYSKDLALADSLSRELLSLIDAQDWPLDLVMPVPLSPQRFQERGYNQAALFAKPLAWGLSIPYRPKALRRIRDTVSQVGLNLEQRKKNVAEAFIASPKYVAGKNILIVDDVATSGSTLNACADALWTANARCVYGLTVARAVQSS